MTRSFYKSKCQRCKNTKTKIINNTKTKLGLKVEIQDILQGGYWMEKLVRIIYKCNKHDLVGKKMKVLKTKVF
jgi:arsenate reductase-like glutaredoxin family protein